MFNNATLLVTGGTGSFGNAFVEHVLSNYEPKKIIVFSRDEMKQWKMSQIYGPDPRVRFFIGDVRDRERVYRALDGVDYLVHAAATKIVPTAEYNPFEAVKTNVLGAMNIIDASIDLGVEKVIALSTDKASSPVNLYGATKLAADKLFSAANAYSGAHATVFSVVRYGNVMGSRGSIIPFFLKRKKAGQSIPVTDPEMTRFMIPLQRAVELVELAFSEAEGGEIFVPKLPSMKILDIVEGVAPGSPIEIVGIRAGEKMHEEMFSESDARNAWEFSDHYRVFNSTALDSTHKEFGSAAHPVPSGFSYSSDKNSDWMSAGSLSRWIEENQSTMLEVG
jgi:UDP-N-acetylglucosamine 4,6-dehydratase